MKDLSVTVRDSFIYLHMQLLRYSSIYLAGIYIYTHLYMHIYRYIHVCVGRECWFLYSKFPRCARVGMLVCTGPSPVVSRAVYFYL